MSDSQCTKFMDASDKAVEFFIKHLAENGAIKCAGFENDPAYYCKLPMMLIKSGKKDAASKVLKYIVDNFVTQESDVRANKEQKTQNEVISMYSSYINGWIAIAASMLDKDLFDRLFKFIKEYHCTENGECFIDATKTEIELLTAAHIGRLALKNNDMIFAEKVASVLQAFITKQNLDSVLYLRCDPDLNPVTSFPAEASALFQIIASDPEQFYFFAGYPAAFLGEVYLATQKQSYLETAKQILDFCLKCHKSILTFHFSHKVAWAASIVYSITKEDKYRQLAVDIAAYLVSLQGDNGIFLADAKPSNKFDQSAEIALWLREIADNLKK